MQIFATKLINPVVYTWELEKRMLPSREGIIFASVNAMVYVSRKEHFNAAHKLYNANWSPEKNREVFGPCANENWHGHNFELIVTVRGVPDPETGFVVDLKKLSRLLKDEIIHKLDHKNLNVDVDFMRGKMASCEVLVVEIWKLLVGPVREITHRGGLYEIKLYETPRNFVTYRGEA